MDEQQHNEELLVRYLDGELTAEEKAAVDQRLRTDVALQEQLLNLRVAVQAIRQLGTVQEVDGVHREMMRELRKEQSGGKVVGMRKYIRYTLAVAASVLVLFIGVRLFLNTQLSPDSIYNETFVDFNVANTRSAASQLSSIETLYQQKEYDKVTTAARSLALAPKDSLLIGLSYLHREDYPSAIRWFHSLSVSQNDYRQDAEFYLGLSYLKTKAYGQALAYLERIHSNPAHLYQQQVSDDTIEKLRKLKNKE